MFVSYITHGYHRRRYCEHFGYNAYGDIHSCNLLTFLFLAEMTPDIWFWNKRNSLQHTKTREYKKKDRTRTPKKDFKWRQQNQMQFCLQRRYINVCFLKKNKEKCRVNMLLFFKIIVSIFLFCKRIRNTIKVHFFRLSI